MTTQSYRVEGMDCTSCAKTLEQGIAKLDQIQTVRVDFATSKLHVEGDATLATLQQRAKQLGYEVIDPTIKETPPATTQQGGVIGFISYLLSRHDTKMAVLGGVIIVLTAIAALSGLPSTISEVLFIGATIIAGYPLALNGIRTLWINRTFSINLLMSIAAVGAILIGETLEASMVIFLFAIGEALEGYTASRARDSLKSLMSLAPPTALRLRTHEGHVDEESVPVEDLQIDDLILVKAGERIPMDGVVTDGITDVNQAPITGESIPVQKVVGDDVFAGTINGTGMVKVRVTQLAQDNTLNRIIQLVEEAQSVRAPSQRFIDRFADIYTPAVVVVALLVATIPPLLFDAPFLDTGDTQGWLYRALALLVISCPCALVISTPVTVISAITASARQGVLIKGGAFMEALGRVNAFAFDKTGTLTHGKPVVTMNRAADCATLEDCVVCDDVLALASAVEMRSSHPLAQAVVNATHQRGLASQYAPAENVQTLAGQGVRGQVGDKLVTVGSHTLFDAEYPHSDAFCTMVQDAEAQGNTTMLVSEGDMVRGFVAVADEIRAESQSVIRDLKALGGKVVMLTGDNPTVAQAVGEQLGVDDVRAGLLPQDKVNAVKELLGRYKRVAMIGDGINDTPALATATVSIAMGGAGSPQALETADIALMADDLKQLPFAVRLSRFAQHLIMQNVLISFGVKVIFLVLALTGFASLWLAILADVGVSLLVTLNGMRPLRFEKQPSEPHADHGI